MPLFSIVRAFLQQAKKTVMITRSASARDVPVVVGRSAALSLPADFPSLSGTARLNAILQMASPGKFISRLREDEFVFLVNGIGLEDAGVLVRYATSGQRKLLVDIDSWDGDEFKPDRFDRILEVVKEHGLDFTVKMLRDLDPGVLILSFVKRAKFHTVEEAEDMEFTPGTWFMTPDGTFVVECADEDDVAAVRNLVDLVYAISVEYAHWLIQGGRWETVSSVQEQSYEYRRSRLADNGFPEEEDPFAIYEPFDLKSFRSRVTGAGGGAASAGTARGEPLALTVADTPGGLFFWKVISSPSAAGLDHAAILSQTMNLVNRVLGASARDLSDMDAWGPVAAHALTVVSLGLEAVSDGDVEIAAGVLRKAVPLELFRAGIEYSRPVSVLARQVVADVGGLSSLSLFGDVAAADIDAAASFPVRCPPSISGSGSEYVDFQTCGQVAAATLLMKKFKAVVQFAKAVLGFEPSADHAVTDLIHPPRFSSVVATAWAHQVLDGAISLKPLRAGDLARLRKTAFEGARIRPGLRLSASGEADEYALAVREFISEALDQVEAGLGFLGDQVDVDPRLIGDCLLMAKEGY